MMKAVHSLREYRGRASHLKYEESEKASKRRFPRKMNNVFPQKTEKLARKGENECSREYSKFGEWKKRKRNREKEREKERKEGRDRKSSERRK